MLVGYARVSTLEQNLDNQLDKLKELGCDKIFTDKVSGAREERVGLKEMLDYVRKGDSIVVYKLDRLARSVKQLISLINSLNEKGVHFKSLSEQIDTSTSGGKLIFHIFASVAEFERDIIRERTYSGLKAARARGRQGGRPKLLNEEKAARLRELKKNYNLSVKEICQMMGIKKSTYYNYE